MNLNSVREGQLKDVFDALEEARKSFRFPDLRTVPAGARTKQPQTDNQLKTQNLLA